MKRQPGLSFLFLTGVLLAGGARGQSTTSNASKSDALLPPLRIAHAQRLSDLASRAIVDRLLIDAERLMLSAKEWHDGLADLEAVKKRLHEAIVTAARTKKDAAKEFWRSRAYTKKLDRLHTKEKKACSATLDEMVTAAKRLRSAKDDAALDVLGRLALKLDIATFKLDRIIGDRTMSRLRKEKADRLHLKNLTLGQSIVGPRIDLAQLRGKVVLWRSFSL